MAVQYRNGANVKESKAVKRGGAPPPKRATPALQQQRRSDARRKTARVVQRQTAPRRLLAPPGAEAVLHYAAALANPFDAPSDVGIPTGGAGLPTFKVTRFQRAVVSSTAAAAAGTYNGQAYALGDHLLNVGIISAADGNVSFVQRAAPSLANTTLATFQCDHSRIVCAAIRIERMGRNDDRGLAFNQIRTTYDGTEAYGDFTPSDVVQLNYTPKSNWDLEFSIPVTGHPTNFSSMIELVAVANVASKFRIDFSITLETNDDTPPAQQWTVGDYMLVSTSITPQAPDLVTANLANVVNVAGLGRFVKPNASQADPVKRDPPQFMRTIKSVAEDANAWMQGAAGAAASIRGAYETTKVLRPLLLGLTL